MAAPTPSTRVTPSGRKLTKGYQTLVTIAADTNIDLWEVSVTPPGIEGDEPLDNTSQLNTTWRTFTPRDLMTMQDMTFTCGWHPNTYSQIIAVINVATTITITFPDASSICFYGYVRSFVPGVMEDGTKPEATVTIKPTMQDPTNCDEQGPVYTAGPGTGPSC